MDCTQRLNSYVNFSFTKTCFRFDWSGKEPLLYDEKVSVRVQPIATGIAHAIFMWWDLNMDTDNQVDYCHSFLFLHRFLYSSL